MRRLAFLALFGLALIQAPAWAGSAGEVTFAAGDVRIGKLAGAEVSAGTTINEGDTLTTGADGHLHVRLADRGLLILRPNSSAVVSDYAFDGGKPSQARMRIVVSRGVVRSITGSWAKAAPEQFRVNTPVAALGVRGTDFTVFTDQHTTRAAVASGGIVMTPLGETCSTTGLGPCEGALATELFAGNQRFVLEAKAGGEKPAIRDGDKLGIHPDAFAPPSADEPPAGPSGMGDQRSAQKSLEALAAGALVDSTKAPTVPEPQRIKWGRWETLLDPNAGDDVRAGRTRVAANARFALFRDTSPTFAMPNEGSASFRLAAHDSFFHDAASGKLTPASIENARLSVDFGKRTFATDFAMRGEGLSTEISARGGLFADGRFVSSVISSNAAVSGALAGDNASQAGFVFHRTMDGGVTAYGATHWAR